VSRTELALPARPRRRPKDNKGWSEQVFKDLTGKDVETQWNEYQATL